MVPKISLSGSLRIEAGDKLTIGDDPTVYRVDAVDKHGDITGFSIVASEPSPQSELTQADVDSLNRTIEKWNSEPLAEPSPQENS